MRSPLSPEVDSEMDSESMSVRSSLHRKNILGEKHTQSAMANKDWSLSSNILYKPWRLPAAVFVCACLPDRQLLMGWSVSDKFLKYVSKFSTFISNLLYFTLLQRTLIPFPDKLLCWHDLYYSWSCTVSTAELEWLKGFRFTNVFTVSSCMVSYDQKSLQHPRVTPL